MSEETSASDSGNAPKRQTERTFNTFTGFPISSDYSESVDKDTLIDEMQNKIGELLKVNQDFCEAKNEMETMRENLNQQQQLLETQRDEYEVQLAELKEKLREREETIASQKQQIQDLTEDKANLEGNIAELKQKLAHLMTRSDDEIQTHTGELRAVVEDKEKEIKDLRLQLDELKSAQVSSSDSAEQQKIENEKLQEKIEKQKGEIERHKAEYERMRAKLEKQAETINELEEKNKKLELTTAAAQGEVKHLKARDVIIKEKLSNREADYFAARDELQRALSFSPGFENVNAMLEFVTGQQKEVASLKAETKKANLTIKKCLKTIQKYEAAFEKMEEEAKDTDHKVKSLEGQVQHQKDKIDKLTKTGEYQKRRLMILPVFDKANRLLTQQLARIRESVHEEEGFVSIRSLASFIVMMNRWKNLCGTEKRYTGDSRNWWWMGSEKSLHLMTEQTAQKITALSNQLLVSNEQREQLEQRLREEQTKSVLTQSELETAKHQIERETTKNQQLESEIQDLHTKIDGRIDTKTYQEMTDKLKSLKEKNRKLKQTLQENDDELERLRSNLNQTKQKLTQQTAAMKQKEHNLQDVQLELFQVQDSVAHLRQGNAIKNRDIMSLERGLNKEKRMAAAMRMQNALLVGENRRLGVQVDTFRSKFDAQP